ncbi:MAG TPA: FUSC family protein [Jatrophihabitans sp.]
MLPWLRRRIDAHDPKLSATKRALRATLVVPINFAIGSQLIGNAQVATFAAFGSFALLLFASFPGTRATRFGAYAALGLAGIVLITVGSLTASPDWLAVVAMAVISFGVLFAGVVSSVINAGVQAALLSFILAVLLPGGRAYIPDRLLGWLIALVVSVPVALFVWPPADQDVLRQRAAQLCRSIGGMLHLDPPAPGEPDPLVAMRAAARELRAAFRVSAAARTAALSTGARLLVRLVDELEWVTTVVINSCSDAPDGWPEQGRRLREAGARLMSACAETLAHEGDGPAAAACADLDTCVADFEKARAAVAAEAIDALRVVAVRAGTTAGEFGRPLYAAHELGYSLALAAQTVSAIATADTRSWWRRLLGRGAADAAQRAASGHLDRHSVWLQNSVRAAAGLTIAVLVARLVGAQNAFWIGLGALSVLRSNALSTGATVLRALAGTVIGFAIGGGLVAIIGTNHAVLWTLFPVVCFVAASAPAVISFAAGQAAFTVFTIILFNIIAPAGWQIGVVRVEDVALGCAASLVAGFLFWPRGAAAALGTAYAEAYSTAARFLRQAIAGLDTSSGAVSTAEVGEVATAAGTRLDDALRQYLAEQGTKRVPLESVAVLAGGAARLRLAGAAINSLHANVAAGVVVPADDTRLVEPATVLQRRADVLGEWYAELADTIAGRAHGLPDVDGAQHAGSFLDVVLPAVHGCGDADRVTRAEQLLWSGQYLGDVDRLRADLIEPAGQVAAAQAHPWWRS